MTEHLIQLRRAWEGTFREGATEIVRRVDLPIVWPDSVREPFRLSRAFNRPTTDPSVEVIELRLEAVPGLSAVHLNDRVIARPGLAAVSVTIPLVGPILARNRVVLEVDPAGWARPFEVWGRVALAIRPA